MMLKKTRDVVVVVTMVLVLSALSGCFVHVDATGWDGHTSWGESTPKLTGSGVEASEVREVEPFDGVAVSGALDVVAEIGPEQRVEVRGDDNLLVHCITEVDDGTLVIRMEPGSYRFKSDMKITITATSLSSAEVTGSSDVTITGIDGESLHLAVTGSGDIKASGTVDQLSCAVSGSGDMKLGDLVARKATVSVAGSGDIHVNATERLDAAVSGSGDVRYRGNPKTSLQTSGLGSVRPSN